MIAIIPARGGSKGLPGKNIRMLNGMPLIAYTIRAALESKHIERVIVTTDDVKIAEIALEYGAEVPFIRPSELALDNTQAIDVYLHAVEYLMSQGEERIDKFMALLPTAPMRNANHIEEAIRIFNEGKARTLISVKEAETPISWYFDKDSNNRIRNSEFGTGNAVTNRQENKSYYIPNGSIYILDYELLKKERTYYCDNTIAFEMDNEHSIDIDTQLDFEIAEFLMQRKDKTIDKTKE